MGDKVKDLYSKLSESENCLYSYSGIIDTDTINNILKKIEVIFEEKEIATKIARKIYNILVEGLQNLYHHVENQSGEIESTFGHKYGMLVLSRNEGVYKIVFGNFVNEKAKNILKGRIDKITGYTKEELKAEYKFVLSNRKMSEKGGGGLGLLDMAKKSDGNLEGEFHQYDKNYYFYILKLVIE